MKYDSILHLLMTRFPDRQIHQMVLYVGNPPLPLKDGLVTPQLTYRYALHDIREVDGTALLQSGNAAEWALALLCGGGSQRQTVRKILESWRDLDDRERKTMAERLIALSGLRKIKDIVEEEIASMPLTHEIIEQSEWLTEARQQGVQSGLRDGMQQGEALVLTKLIQHRFGLLPQWATDPIAGGAPPQLERWALQLLDASSIQDVFADG